MSKFHRLSDIPTNPIEMDLRVFEQLNQPYKSPDAHHTGMSSKKKKKKKKKKKGSSSSY